MTLRKNLVRLQKILCSLQNPCCWKPLLNGVAPSIEHHGALRGLDIDGVIDVGANRGQFALECRLLLPGVPVVSFEPIPAAAALFRKVHSAAPSVTLVETALGDSAGTATLHLSRSADSSSLLPIGDRQTSLFKNTEEVGTIKVPLKRLDDMSAFWEGRMKQLLKLDVQGFELSVLRGSIETLKTCRYVYAECSEFELYQGQALRRDVTEFLQHHGFTQKGRFNEQTDRGELIQADYLFRSAH